MRTHARERSGLNWNEMRTGVRQLGRFGALVASVRERT